MLNIVYRQIFLKLPLDTVNKTNEIYLAETLNYDVVN
jgi:hypothetical protein